MANAKITVVEDAKAEAASDVPQDITFTFDGHDYVIDGEARLDLELFEAIEDDKFMTAMRGFLGAEQWAEFKDRVRNANGRVTLSDAEPFLGALMEALGEGN